MMGRDIKFRAWDGDRMLYLDDFGGFIKNGRYAECVQGEIYEDEYPLMQYTGLKDKNGKEIYEGDILRYWFLEDKEEDFMLVYFKQGCWCVGYKDDELLNEDLQCEYFEITIVGNFYENPKLL